MIQKPKQSIVSRVNKYQNIDIYRRDGWTNVLAGIGKRGTDKTTATIFQDTEILVDKELTALWIGEGLGKRIVEVVADDMVRNWINIPEDEDGKLEKELNRLDAIKIFTEALYWTRLYKGAIIVVGANDGRKLNKPLNPKAVKSIDWIKVYPATTDRIRITEQDFVKDPTSKYFGDIEVFTLYNLYSRVPFQVHASRCLVFKGEPIPSADASNITTEMKYWGMSILNPIWTRLKNFGAAEQGIANLMYEIVIGKYTMSNLSDILADNNTDAIYTRLEVINASKSLINAVLLGENENYTRDTANLAGVPEMLDRFMMVLSGIVGIPVTRLFGRSPAGQNATGESDTRNYYDMISSKQGTILNKPIQTLINLINMYIQIDKLDEDVSFEFNPVWEPSQAELIDMRLKQAQTDNLYVMNGSLTPEEIAENRFGRGTYSFETTIEEGIEREPMGTETTGE